MTIINRHLGFIFLKSRKTASSSIENHLILNTELGADIYSTSREIIESGRPRSINYRPLWPGQKQFWYTPGDKEQRFRSNIRGGSKLLPSLSQHDSAARVRFLVGSRFFESAIKAVPIRNPWDALVSYYEWERSGGQGRKAPMQHDWSDWFRVKMSPKAELHGVCEADKFLFHDHTHLNNRFLPMIFIVFEDIDYSLRVLRKRLGLADSRVENMELYLKNSKRSGDYRSYYNDEQAATVERIFNPYIQKLGYSFDQPGRLPDKWANESIAN